MDKKKKTLLDFIMLSIAREKPHYVRLFHVCYTIFRTSLSMMLNLLNSGMASFSAIALGASDFITSLVNSTPAG